MIFSSGSIIACSRKVAPVVFNPVWQKPTQKSLDLAYSFIFFRNLDLLENNDGELQMESKCSLLHLQCLRLYMNILFWWKMMLARHYWGITWERESLCNFSANGKRSQESWCVQICLSAQCMLVHEHLKRADSLANHSEQLPVWYLCGQLPCAPKFNENWGLRRRGEFSGGVKKTAMLQLDWNEQHNAFIWGTWSRKSSNVGNQEATEADGNPGRWITQGICQSAKHKFVIHDVHTKKSLRWFHLTHHSENQWSLHLGSLSTLMFKDS
jgi:hypothetical protein